MAGHIAGATPSTFAEPVGSVAAPRAAMRVAPAPGILPSIGSTRGLEILPLVDWLTASPQLRGEAGVSYLVRTDGHTVLFDVGGNFQEDDLSPLIANMKQLGVDLRTVDTIVISHAHGDHVGGQRFARQQRFALGGGAARCPARQTGGRVGTA
jgi:glyoxylase-like metal-dependent hydrolase (beta-lactamase superfamily II)